MQEAKTYYANISCCPTVEAQGGHGARQRLGGLTLKMVAPSPGVIWRSHL